MYHPSACHVSPSCSKSVRRHPTPTNLYLRPVTLLTSLRGLMAAGAREPVACCAWGKLGADGRARLQAPERSHRASRLVFLPHQHQPPHQHLCCCCCCRRRRRSLVALLLLLLRILQLQLLARERSERVALATITVASTTTSATMTTSALTSSSYLRLD